MSTEQANMASDSSADTGTFDTIAQAVAELDRREAARKSEAKAAKAAPAVEDGETEDDDADPRRVDKPKADKPSDKEEKKPPRKAEKADEAEEDDAEEPDEDDGDEESDEDDEAEEEAKPKAKKAEAADTEADDDSVEIEHEGKKHRVPAALKDAFLRHADYTQKTQAIAQERETVHQTYAQAQASIQQASQAQATLMQFAQAMVGQEPPLELAQSDPGEYLRQRTLHEQRQRALQTIAEQGKAVQAQQQQMQQAQQAQQRQVNEQLLYQHAPELKSPQNKAAFVQVAGRALEQFGFAPDELLQVNDARTLLMVRRLLQLEHQIAGQAKTAGDVKQRLANVPSKTLKPGAADAQGAKTRTKDEAKRKFMRSGRTMKDVERYLASMS